MKLGILADIHEHVEHLQAALARFDALGVDRVIVLGDLYEMGRRIRETVLLLQQANAVGVWGNHDLGLCFEQSEDMLAKYAGPVIDYMSSLQPRLLLDEVQFSHVDPYLDPRDPLQIWWFGERPDEPGIVQKSFDAVPQRHLFVGHYHRWQYITPERPMPWRGEAPLVLDAPRSFVIVHAVYNGHAALFDTDTRLLTPLSLLGT
jgi:hypothetical protein